MHKKHWEHHNECGTPGADPDFHTGDDSLPKWFLNFMKTYVSLPQFVKLQTVSTLLMMVGHAPLPNLLLFWAGAGMVSAGRLFYFGTYEPHRPDAEAWVEGEPPGSMPWWRSRTTDAPTWLTFLRCWNFSLHVEHHQVGGKAFAEVFVRTSSGQLLVDNPCPSVPGEDRF
jgi:beta-carotene ketolase (CrtW type)